MNKYSKKYNIKNYLFIILVIICGMFFACQDNFDDTIKKENNTKNNNNEQPGIGWTKKAYISTPRAGAATVVSGDYLYIYGGENDLGIYGDFVRYDLLTGSYETLPFFGAIAYANMVELNGTLYIFGGKNSSKNPTQNLKRYDILNKTWDEVIGPSGFNGPMPSEIFSHVTLAYTPDTSIFVHGGFGDEDGILYKLIDPDAVFPPDKPVWDEFAEINLFLAEHSAAIINDKIYFFGGVDTATGAYKNDLYMYDILTTSFAKLNPSALISARSAMQIVPANNGLYVYGGKNASGYLNDVWFYSFSNNRWEYIGVGPGKRCHYNAFKYSNKLYIYGGYYQDNTGQQIFYCDLWEYQLD